MKRLYGVDVLYTYKIQINIQISKLRGPVISIRIETVSRSCDGKLKRCSGSWPRETTVNYRKSRCSHGESQEEAEWTHGRVSNLRIPYCATCICSPILLGGGIHVYTACTMKSVLATAYVASRRRAATPRRGGENYSSRKHLLFKLSTSMGPLRQ